MKNLVILIIAISLFHSLTISQWVQQTSGITAGLQDCDFINENTGWACGNGGVILKTTNGGAAWFQQSSGVSKILWGIDAIDENWISCVGEWDTMLKSTNSGNTWLVIRDGPTSSPTFLKTYFLNQNTGWLLKTNYILRTIDGGNTFDSTHTIYSYIRDVHFKDANTGIICGDGALILRSTDGGVSWSRITLPLHQGGMPDFFRLSIIGNNLGWTVGGGDNSGLGKLVFRTTNFGITWDTIGRVLYPNGQLNYSVCFSSPSTGYCGGTSGLTFKTVNGGLNWFQQIVPSNGYRGDFHFISDTVGWSIGGGGQIFKTENGGTYVGIEPVTGTTPLNFKLHQNYPNPFNNQTRIEFQISEWGKYRLEVFDILGRKVDELFNKKFNAGVFRIIFDAAELSSGVYIYRLTSERNSEMRKFILIK